MPLSQELIDAVIHQESHGDPRAVNKRTGATGLMQIMTATGKQPGFGVAPISAKDRLDPVKNRRFGTAYLNALSDKYNGNVANALAAYNWGPGNVDRWLKKGASIGALPRETKNYIFSILGNRGNAPRGLGLEGISGSSSSDTQFGAGGVDALGGGDGLLGNLSGMSDDDLDDALKLAEQGETAELKASKAAAAKRQAALKALANARSSAPPANFSPAPSGAGKPLPLALAQGKAVSAPGGNPLQAQQALVSRLLNPSAKPAIGGLLNRG